MIINVQNVQMDSKLRDPTYLNVVRPQQVVETVLHNQLGAKCSVKMKLCDPMYRDKAR